MTLGRAAIATLIMVGLLLYYALSCALWPMADCWCCSGAGHHRPAGDHKTHRRGRLSRPCRWCKHTGKRWRWGRRLWNHARRKHRAAQ